MSSKLTETARRSDLWFVDPYDITIKEELRGRHTAPSEEKIIRRAISLHRHGQRQPVEVRRTGDAITLVSGFTRSAAGRLLRDGFDYEGVRYHDPEFVIQCRVVTADDKQAFIHNIVENAHRDETTPIDDAHNMVKLKECYGYSVSDIAELYHFSASTVHNTLRMIEHEPDAQELIANRSLSVKTALSLLELPVEERRIAIKQAVLADGRISGETVRKQVRSHHLRDEDGSVAGEATDSSAKPPAKSRSVKELREFFEQVQGEVPEPQTALCAKIVQYIAGTISDRSMINALKKVTEGEAK